MPALDLRLFGLVTVAMLVVAVSTWRKRRSLPPGPKGLPILGNIFDVPKEFEWLSYDKWSRELSASSIILSLA